ncbi:hypothetical protein CDAR_479601 [Caerostris darwini]|uniref:Gustatory receptor n=1 Tax=Caerostris darwini TaxID=1538125 RepID=A0AAV4MTJ2_9ARAC|nr:hypothetical protein CDAR_479601 [Caerostris darwini]
MILVNATDKYQIIRAPSQTVKKTSTKRKFDFFFGIFKLLYLFGLDIGGKKSKKATVKNCLSVFNLRAAMFHLVCVNLTYSMFLYDFRKTEKTVRKVSLVRKVPELFTFLLWYSVYYKRNSIKNLMSRIHHVNQELSLSTTTAVTVTGFAAILVIFIVAPLSILLFESEETLLFYTEYYNFGVRTFGAGVNYAVTVPTIFAYYFYIFTFPACVCVLYSALCLTLKRALVAHASLARAEFAGLRKRHLLSISGRYGRILGLVEHFEDALSLVAFFLSFHYFICVFYFLNIYQSHQESSPYAKYVFYGLYGIVSYVGMAMFASSVTEADRAARRANRDLFRRAHPGGGEGQSTDPERAFALTGWGCFTFTKSFILAAFGSILTYTLLLMQLD